MKTCQVGGMLRGMSDAKPSARAVSGEESPREVLPHQVEEVLGGTPVLLPPPGPIQIQTGIRLLEVLSGGLGKDAGAWVLRRNLPVHLSEDRLVPDLAGWRRERWKELEPGEVVTLAPDWACEVLSEETEPWDRGHKMLAYGLGRVGHVWLVHPGMRTLEVYLFEGYSWSLLDVWEAQGPVKAAPFEALAWDLSALWAG
ncbi:Uma2 family endonuclease [Stigmatella sp. ncwal1]|uniref:Uma2 family endonuclease n=1 Tax=Stigmatella ashevillensis TaxID=2995309 RepID=A0ABT5DA46_9BACT|nr:Uma2 family endonuclease [Stigmatella ashevillena]MDC0710565.1 Uma2 family endonuclease [Stigmatella ashevillena]